MLPSVVLLFCFPVLLSPSLASHQLPSWAHRVAVASAAFKQPYRTAFHFQPLKNWMNDPNAPLFYKGYYHLFYQYNPGAAYWGNITWGHAVSTDLIHWLYLEEALVPDHWYDIKGCWSGSATFLADGNPAILYTGWSNSSQQMQNMAVPADLNDPLLRKWVKVPQNPLIVATANLNSSEFRDPTTAWIGADGKWRILIGSKRKHRGLALVYKSPDFLHWEGTKHCLHTVPLTGMWECPDFYPVSLTAKSGINTSINGPNVKHVLKVSLDNTKHDHYTTGKYLESSDSFVPDTLSLDAGVGLRYDYGKFYASKTFYDAKKGRRILLGWVNESDSQADDISKGWASVHAIPRIVWLDNKRRNHLLQWPVEEVEMLRGKKTYVEDLLLLGGSIVKVKGAEGAQLDLEVYFEMRNLNQAADVVDVASSNPQELCSQGGPIQNSVAGPFGLLLLASADLREQTAVSLHVFRSTAGWQAVVCSDQTRSSLSPNLDKTAYGTSVSGDEESLSLRILVDHSIVETFAQGGKACITSRVYPTLAIDEAAHLYLFNNGTTSIQVKSIAAWKMESANLHNF